MSNRMLRDWTDSEKVNNLSAEAERFFIRLIMKADDYGRYYANIKLLRANLFPLHEKLKEEKLESWLKECTDLELIYCYEVAGKRYLEIKMFNQKLKVRRSKYPPSNEDDYMALSEGYVYLIGTDYNNPVKIGFSVNPWSRLKEITANHPEKIEILLSIKADKKLESEIHKSIKNRRVKNEWFLLNHEIIDCLISFSKGEMSRDKLLVDIRSYSYELRSSSEKEVEVEVEKEEEVEVKKSNVREQALLKMFKNATSGFDDDFLLFESRKFLNKYPNCVVMQAGGLVNSWASRLNKQEQEKWKQQSVTPEISTVIISRDQKAKDFLNQF